MNSKNLLRKAVIKTNSYWPFSFLYRAFYHMAVKYFVQSYKKFPQIRSIYITLNSPWIPGVSDIDFLLVLNSRNFDFLNILWERWGAIKKYLPMIDYINMVDDKDLKTWIKFKHFKAWMKNRKLVYGEDVFSNNYIADFERFTMHSLNHAMHYYAYWFLHCFKERFLHCSERTEDPYLGYLLRKRVTLKILRRVSYFETFDVARKKAILNQLINRNEMLYRIIKGLDEGAKRFVPPKNVSNSRIDIKNKVNFSIFRSNRAKRKIPNAEKLTSLYGEAIESIMLTYEIYPSCPESTLIIVLKDGLDDLTMKNFLNAISDIFAQEHEALMPLVITHRTFKYLISFCDPWIYLCLAKERVVLYGKDLIQSSESPLECYFIENLLSGSIDLLFLSIRYTFHFSTDPSLLFDWIWSVSQYYLERFLLFKLYTQKGIIKAGFDELLAECQKYYPELYTNIKKLKEMVGCEKNEETIKRWFDTVGNIKDDMNSCLSNYKNF